MLESLKYLKKYLVENKRHRVVLANSGGPDSMSVLHLLLIIRKTFDLEIISAHVNHNIRLESNNEEIFLKEFCKHNKVIFESMKIDHYSNENFHEQSRKIRYDFFKKVLKKHNTDILITAHHGDDLIETILMRLTRGSSLKGYSGFSICSKMDNYTILRPLVYVSKQDILNYNKKNNIKFVTDMSNFQDKYTRNRYRKNMVSFLHNEDENVHIKFLKFSKILSDTFEHLNKEVEYLMSKIYLNNRLNIKYFLKEDSIIKKLVIEKILEIYYQEDISLISDIHVNSIIDLIESKKPNSIIILPKKVVGIKSYNEFYLEEKITSKIDYRYEFNDNLVIGELSFNKVIDEESNNNYIFRLLSNEVKFPLYFRNRKEKDKIMLRDLGEKKVKDIFIDSKIPINKRNEVPMLVDSGNKILWIVGIKKSKYGKKKDETYDIIIKCNKGEIYEEKKY